MQENNPPVPENHPKNPAPPVTSRRRSPFVLAWLLLALLLAWQWYDNRERTDALKEELAQRLRASDTESRDAMLIARQSRESLIEAQAKIAQLGLKLADAQNRQASIESLYRDLSRGRDEWVLAEVEQILVIASQQLQLTANVPAALAALQTADARLARAGRATFAPLRAALARDIARLKAAPRADIPGIAAKIDRVMTAVDALPLAQAARPQAQPQTNTSAPPEPFWARLSAWVADGLKQLVRVDRMDRDDVALLPPAQLFFLRENLKLRLMSVRLALLAHDEAAYRRDLLAVSRWIERYFDTGASDTGSALATLKEIAAEGAGVTTPSIAEGLAAVRGFKSASGERTSR